MPDIYSRTAADFAGSFSADAASIAFSSLGAGALVGGGVGLVTQNLSFNYSQQITTLYEIGSNKKFLIAGRTQGQAAIGRLLGPRPVQLEFYRKFGNVCNAASNTIDFRAQTGCQSGVSLSGGAYAFSLRGCAIQNISVSVAATDMIVNEQLSMMFCSLDLAAA